MGFGRKQELTRLEQAYAKGGGVLILTGREGIGKTTLLRAFMQGKRTLYYLAREGAEREQQQLFEAELRVNYGLTAQAEPSVSRYETLLLRLAQASARKKERCVMIFDEFHHMTDGGSAFMQALAKVFTLPEKPFILLTTSKTGWAKNEMFRVLGAVSEQVTEVRELSELSFMEISEWFPELSLQDCIRINGILGGVPGYLKYWDSAQTVRENIKALFLSEDAPLFQKPERLLKLELRELGAYNAIMEALASGNTRLNDIYLKTGFSRAKISVYLKNLMQMGLVEKLVSCEAEQGAAAQKGLYRLSDCLFAFWYRFLYPNQSILALGHGEWLLERQIDPQLETHFEASFRQVCTEYLKIRCRYQKLAARYDRWGSWFGRDGRLDIVAEQTTGGEKATLIGCCYWQEAPVDMQAYTELLETVRTAGLAWTELYLFAKTGFDEALRKEIEEKKEIICIRLQDL